MFDLGLRFGRRDGLAMVVALGLVAPHPAAAQHSAGAQASSNLRVLSHLPLGQAFHLADVLLVCDIYPAGEEAVPGVTAEALARSIGERGHRQAAYAGDLKSAIDRLAAEVKDGDVVLTLGAGSVWTAGDELLRRRGA